MKTSRSALDRLLDPSNISVILQTLERAAVALAKKLHAYTPTENRSYLGHFTLHPSFSNAIVFHEF